MSESFKCACGKVCTSQPGLTLHQKNCDAAKSAVKSSAPVGTAVEAPTDKCEPVECCEKSPLHSKEVQEFVDRVEEIAGNWDECIAKGNKSAGRRARVALSGLKKDITAIRSKINDLMKK